MGNITGKVPPNGFLKMMQNLHYSPDLNYRSRQNEFQDTESLLLGPLEFVLVFGQN